MAQAGTDPLQQLRDIHLSGPPSWWPPAPGWWLMMPLLVALVLLSWHLVRRWRAKRAPLKEALKNLDHLKQSYEHCTLSELSYADQVDRLLKRALIHTGHRQEIARLSGEPWLDYLADVLADPGFPKGAGRTLGDQRFRPHPELAPDSLYALTRRILLKLMARK